VQTPSNQELKLTAVIFFDITHSRPVGTTFTADQPIIFNGVEHRIVTVEDIYDDEQLHHWELGVV
jgi:plasmid replication initiation protein